MNLLTDILQQALADPQDPHSWHRLAVVWEVTADDELKRRVFDALVRVSFKDLRTEYLRLTFLRDLPQHPDAAHLAAQCLQQLKPLIADRTAAFVCYSWGRALIDSENRDQIVKTMLALQLPQMVADLGRAASKALPTSFVPRVSQTVGRVAIISPCFGNAAHTPSVLTLQVCRVLASIGVTTELFGCQEQIIPDSHRFSGGNQMVILPTLDQAYWAAALPEGQQLHCSDTRLSLNARWQQMFSKIEAYDPDVVLLCGLYCPMAMAIYHRRPVLGLNVHAMPLLSPVDVRLSSLEDEDMTLSACWHPTFSTPFQQEFSYRIFPPLASGHTHRADLDISEAAVVWITVGARLSEEIRPPWGARIAGALRSHPNVIWVLVGCGQLPACLGTSSSEQIRALPYRKDVGDLMRLADIYINPDRMGGGFSVAEAMAMGLATLSLQGSDGGNKLGHDAHVSLDEYLSALHDLTLHRQRRVAFGQRLRERFDQKFNLEHAGPSLLCALGKAIEYGGQRLLRAASS